MMKTQDVINMLKIAGVIAVGVGAYLVVTRVAKTGGKVVETAKEVITKDLNPASSDNLIYSNLSDGVKNSIGKVFDFFGGTDYYADDPSNVKKQAPLLAPKPESKPLPPTGAGSGQSSPAFAAKDPRRLDNPNYKNPFSDADKIDYSTINAPPGGLFKW
jgi:hypothetical protein